MMKKKNINIEAPSGVFTSGKIWLNTWIWGPMRQLKRRKHMDLKWMAFDSLVEMRWNIYGVVKFTVLFGECMAGNIGR